VEHTQEALKYGGGKQTMKSNSNFYFQFLIPFLIGFGTILISYYGGGWISSMFHLGKTSLIKIYTQYKANQNEKENQKRREHNRLVAISQSKRRVKILYGEHARKVEIWRRKTSDERKTEK